MKYILVLLLISSSAFAAEAFRIKKDNLIEDSIERYFEDGYHLGYLFKIKGRKPEQRVENRNGSTYRFSVEDLENSVDLEDRYLVISSTSSLERDIIDVLFSPLTRDCIYYSSRYPYKRYGVESYNVVLKAFSLNGMIERYEREENIIKRCR